MSALSIADSVIGAFLIFMIGQTAFLVNRFNRIMMTDHVHRLEFEATNNRLMALERDMSALIVKVETLNKRLRQ